MYFTLYDYLRYLEFGSCLPSRGTYNRGRLIFWQSCSINRITLILDFTAYCYEIYMCNQVYFVGASNMDYLIQLFLIIFCFVYLTLNASCWVCYFDINWLILVRFLHFDLKVLQRSCVEF